MQRLVPPVLIALSLHAAAATGATLDWDAVAWPAGNLARTFNGVGGGDVTITFSGETGGLVPLDGSASPVRTTSLTGGLSPAQNALGFETDYTNAQTPELTITLDFSHLGGVDGVSFSVFEVDRQGSNHIDELEVTATDGGTTFDPSSVVAGACNAFDGINTVTGTCSSNDTSPTGTATFTFAQTGITRVTIVYRNLVQPNPGRQHVAIHDISFDDVAADLSLSLAASDLSPAVGDGITFTLTAYNAGPGVASGVVVSCPLPPGFGYTGDDGAGAYVPGSGLWTVGAIPVAGSAVLEVTGSVNAGGSHDVVAEISAADQPDPDSTPGNGDPTEDDRDVVSPAVEPLGIAKRAFAADGSPLANAATLSSGARIRFLLYVNNRGDAVADVSLEDVLDPELVYVPGSLRIDTSTPACVSATCTPAEEASILAAANAAATVTDAEDGDAASVAATTLSIGDRNAPGNAQLDIPGDRVLAVRFEVRIE